MFQAGMVLQFPDQPGTGLIGFTDWQANLAMPPVSTHTLVACLGRAAAISAEMGSIAR